MSNGVNKLEEQEFIEDFDINLWKKIYRFCLKYKKNFAILLFADIMLALGDLMFPQMSKYAIDTFVTGGGMETLPVFAVLFAALICFNAFNIYTFINQAGKIEVGITHDIRETAFKKLQELSFSYYDTTPVGWIMARMTSDAHKIGDIIAWGLVDIVWAVSFIILVVIVMFLTNVKLAFIVSLTMPCLTVITIFFRRRILDSNREARKINSKITGALNEGINGSKTTKTLIREQENYEEFQELTSDMKRAGMRVGMYNSLFFPLVFLTGNLAVAALLNFGGMEVLNGAITVGTLSMFTAYATQMFEPINNIARMFSEIQSAQASAERTMSLIEKEPDVTDSGELIAVYGDALNPKRENWPVIKGDIEFKNVSFSYKTGEKVLEDFSLKINAGERIALVGETGSGKSTIINLICRFYEPTGGEILIDGVNYKERTQGWLQSNIGYVLQTPHLFSGTIKDNIRYGKLDATDEEIINAAKTVNAYRFIQKFEKGVNTDVGEGGNRLSTGEKQLVSFARAIVGDPRIFVLDEATSSIDTETEQVITSAIAKVLSGRTSFIVAHRLSTIRSCDRILVIDNGKVIESGSHKELIRLRGHYYELYTNQFREEAGNLLLK